MLDLVGNPDCCFSHAKVQLSASVAEFLDKETRCLKAM